jgi:hypothetical protein
MTTQYTPAGLLDTLEKAGHSPRVAGCGLMFDVRPPVRFIKAVRLLHTGVRALLTSRVWVGCSTKSGWSQGIDPQQLIPSWVGLLAVKGDLTWDRIRPLARLDLPACFVTKAEPRGRDRLPRRQKKVVA